MVRKITNIRSQPLPDDYSTPDKAALCWIHNMNPDHKSVQSLYIYFRFIYINIVYCKITNPAFVEKDCHI